MNKKNLIQTPILIIGGIAFIVYPSLADSLGRKVYTITNEAVSQAQDATSAVTQAQVLGLQEKIAQARKLVGSMTLRVSGNLADYYETRAGVRKKFTDAAEKEIALALLNKDNGQIETIKILKRGGDLINIDPKYNITVKERASGVKWNNFNTQYEIKPANYILLANKYPVVEVRTTSKKVKNSRGKMVTVRSSYPTIEEVVYTPYSKSIHIPEVVAAGRLYIKGKVQQAYEDLRQRGVYSLAQSNKPVSDVVPSDFIEKIPMLEQTDLDEFYADPETNFERVLVLIGANQDLAFKYTGNFAGAIGWVQFTRPTYNGIKKSYPKAGLISDFNTGGRDHLNSIKAAILLHDYNLAGLIDKFGPQIVNDPKLEEYLAASYNGAPRWVYASITTAAKNPLIGEWGTHLRTETKGFLAKLRFLDGWFE